MSSINLINTLSSFCSARGPKRLSYYCCFFLSSSYSSGVSKASDIPYFLVTLGMTLALQLGTIASICLAYLTIQVWRVMSCSRQSMKVGLTGKCVCPFWQTSAMASICLSIFICACSHLFISNLIFSWAILFGLPYFLPVPSLADRSSR